MAFPTTLDSDFGTLVDSTDYPQAAHVNTLRRAVEGLEAKVGINSSAVTSSLDYKCNNFFVPATKLYFYADSPPTGWTTGGVADSVLAVKGGSQAYGTTGGTGVGKGSFSISILNMPSHQHGVYKRKQVDGGGAGSGYCFYGTDDGNGYYNSIATGSGDGNYRPYASVGIIAYNGNFT